MRSALFGAAIFSMALTQPVFAQGHEPASFPATLPHKSGLAMEEPRLTEDAVLASILASASRPQADRDRDVYRHPLETLTFWGLHPQTTIVELDPGRAGWWRNILEPYAAATSGQYVPVANPRESMGVADGTADLVIVARSLHNWQRGGFIESNLAAIFKALKPGGVLAIEQHRSVEGVNVNDVVNTGYVPESWVIHQVRAAGFELDARSEINANAKDDRDHPFGVWTLPPSRRSQANDRTLSEAERAEYDAIGESDRMTLRFRKPAA